MSIIASEVRALVRRMERAKQSNEVTALCAWEAFADAWECFDMPGNPAPVFAASFPREALIVGVSC